jgi:hypothetical protein
VGNPPPPELLLAPLAGFEVGPRLGLWPVTGPTGTARLLGSFVADAVLFGNGEGDVFGLEGELDVFGTGDFGKAVGDPRNAFDGVGNAVRTGAGSTDGVGNTEPEDRDGLGAGVPEVTAELFRGVGDVAFNEALGGARLPDGATEGLAELFLDNPGDGLAVLFEEPEAVGVWEGLVVFPIGVELFLEAPGDGVDRADEDAAGDTRGVGVDAVAFAPIEGMTLALAIDRRGEGEIETITEDGTGRTLPFDDAAVDGLATDGDGTAGVARGVEITELGNGLVTGGREAVDVEGTGDAATEGDEAPVEAGVLDGIDD